MARGWLEEPGRVLSRSAITMRYGLMVAAITAIELGYKEGISVGLAILTCSHLYHGHLIERFASYGICSDADDPRPRHLEPGKLQIDGLLLGINPLTFRALLVLVAIVVIQLGHPKAGGFFGLFVLYSGTESAMILLGRVLENLVQIEVVRRVAIKMGCHEPTGWGRGDEKR